MGGEETRYITEAFQGNWIAPVGENINGFEQDLEQYLGEGKVAALVTGTAALHLALVLLGVDRGDEVICQSLTFAASANPIIYQGATPIFVDSEVQTWNMCPNILEETIQDRIAKGKRPKAIIIVNLYGMPAKMADILEISKKYEIPLIEDAAEALGSSYCGKKCGTFGDYSILSFNGNKIITTSGGGALVCANEEQKEKAIYWATQAKEKTYYYQHLEVGYNYRMSNILAGIGRGQMKVLEERVIQRRENHSFYEELFRGVDGINLLTELDDRYYSNHWLSVININQGKTGLNKEIIMDKLSGENIESRPVWKPLHLQPVFKEMPYYGGDTAQRLFEEGLCLPSGSNLSIEDKDRIKNIINSML